MKQRIVCLAVLMLFGLEPLFADAPEIGSSQNLDEKTSRAVVRNKRYYKAGKIELGVSAGLMPYDSAVESYTAGARLTWHISDHYGWEIIDFQKSFSSVTSFITGSGLIGSVAQIQKLDVLKPNMMIGSNFVMSPLYGKIRFFGVLYLDMYVVAGLGFVDTQTIRYSFTNQAGSVVNTGMDFAINYGVGFKFFMTNAFTGFIDLRNYMSNSMTYDARKFSSFFTVSGGISLVLPNFG